LGKLFVPLFGGNHEQLAISDAEFGDDDSNDENQQLLFGQHGFCDDSP